MVTERESAFNPDQTIQFLSSDQRKNHFIQELQRIIDYAYRHAPAIRRRLDEAGFHPSQFKTLKDLERVPVLKKEDLKKDQQKDPPFGGYLAVPLDALQRVYVSPGPIYDPEERENRRPMEAKIMSAVGFGPGERVIVSLSYHMVPAGLLFDKALREVGALAVPAGTASTESQVEAIKELRITGYIGTGIFLMNLAQKAKEKGFLFPEDFPVKNALLAGEAIPPDVRRFLEEDCRIRTWQGYGTADIGLFAFECERKSGMHLADEVYAEIVDPQTGRCCEPGEVGEVVVTYLNPTYPLIRFGTGDLSLMDDQPCDCGRSSPRLMKIMGRTGDSYKVRGLFIHGSQVRDALSKIEGLTRYSLIISRCGNRDELILKAELKEPKHPGEDLIEILSGRIKDICRLRVDRVEFVSPGILAPDCKPLIDSRTD